MTRAEALCLLDDIDGCDREVTEWEAELIDSLLKQAEADDGWVPSDKQAAVLRKMEGKYL